MVGPHQLLWFQKKAPLISLGALSWMGAAELHRNRGHVLQIRAVTFPFRGVQALIDLPCALEVPDN